jgi:hypothetical protein
LQYLLCGSGHFEYPEKLRSSPGIFASGKSIGNAEQFKQMNQNQAGI